MKDLKYIAAIKSPAGEYNDIEINSDGDIATVEGMARVKQDVVKILMTENGLMPYPNYGTSLSALPSDTPYSTTLLNSISSEVIAAIHYLIFIEESKITAEQISEIKKLDVSFAGNAVDITLELVTKDKEDVIVGFTV